MQSPTWADYIPQADLELKIVPWPTDVCYHHVQLFPLSRENIDSLRKREKELWGTGEVPTLEEIGLCLVVR